MNYLSTINLANAESLLVKQIQVVSFYEKIVALSQNKKIA